MANRIVLVHLTMVGPSVAPATVDFGPKATIIRGPSDTGKSLIAEAIDFMLGRAKIKEVPELNGYTLGLLGVTLPDRSVITLSRPLNGGRFGLLQGDVRTYPDNAPADTLAIKHSDENDENISAFLLRQIGLQGRRVRKNARNTTVGLSFRNVARLCVIDETAMQSPVPPALSGRDTNRTAEISTFRIVLQDDDDSDLVELQSRADQRKIVNAKSEVLDELLMQLEQRVRDSPGLNMLRQQHQRLLTDLANRSTTAGNLMGQRAILMEQLETAERLTLAARRKFNNGVTVRERFNLLLDQYDSDLSRLNMVAEAGSLLGYFQPGQCVFCGADPSDQHFNHDVATDTTSFGTAVTAEYSRTEVMRADLIATIEALQSDLAELEVKIDAYSQQDVRVRLDLRTIDDALGPEQESLQEIIGLKSELETGIEVFEQIERINELKSAVAAESQAEQTSAIADLNTSALRELSSKIADRLTKWGFPGGSTVRYDREAQDLIADGQLRSAHGKGVRAILHAAFSIGLADYCFANGRPHPGFVVLDSPLVTYRPPRAGEDQDAVELDARVGSAFYADLAGSFDGQVVIMENVDPPANLNTATQDIEFTRNPTLGRFGFLIGTS